MVWIDDSKLRPNLIAVDIVTQRVEDDWADKPF